MNPAHLATITPGSDPLGRDNAVTLCDGSVVSTWSPEWRAECLERHNDAMAVLSLSSREARRRHVDTLTARRGAVYGARLEAEVKTVWHARRAAASGASDA